MRTRIIAGLAFVGLTAFCFLFGDITRLAYIIFVAWVSCHEMVSQTKKAKKGISVWQGYAFIILFALVDIFKIKFDFMFYGLLVIMMLSFVEKILIKRNMTMEELFVSMGVCLYPVAPIMMIFHICCVKGMYWPIMIVLPFVAVVFNDSVALVSGMLFGKHKMAPHISPKKTIEGLIGGLIAGVIGGVFVYLLFYYCGWDTPSLAFCLIAALVASIAGVFGDLAASAIKRDIDVKDFGKIIPGHGGLLDRIDSSMFAIAAVYIAFHVGALFG